MGEKIQFWIWLIVIVATLIARARKKLRQDNERRPAKPSPSGTEYPPASKPLSFDELLREIEAAKPKPTVTERPVLRQQPAEAEYQRSRQETYDLYEKAKQEAFNRPSLEETLKLDNTVVRFGQFKSYQAEHPQRAASLFAEEIRNPSSFRKAFIMSEILNRRF